MAFPQMNNSKQIEERLVLIACKVFSLYLLYEILIAVHIKSKFPWRLLLGWNV